MQGKIKKILKFNDSTASSVPVVVSFLRSNAAAIVATSIDFGVLILGREFLNLPVILSTVIGFCVGATVSFMLTRNWAFKRQDGDKKSQALKFAMTAGVGLLLNTLGMWGLVELLGEAHYIISRVITAVVVGFLFSFFMYRYFVFK